MSYIMRPINLAAMHVREVGRQFSMSYLYPVLKMEQRLKVSTQ